MDPSPVCTAGVPGLGLAVVLVGQVPVKVLVRVQREGLVSSAFSGSISSVISNI